MDMAKDLRGRKASTARPLRLAAATATAGLLLTLTACQDDGADRADDGRTPIVAPGRPGEKSRTLSPEQAAKAKPDDSPNAADHAYVQRMIEHHRQALTMSELAPERAAADPVKRLAERITAGQKPEIGAMQKWLALHPAPAAGSGTAAPGHGPGHGTGHDHASMPGMATEQQLRELADARGADFDRLFLKLMTAHHEGALTMAGEALAGGNNPAVEEMANEVVATQSAEIHRMRTMG
ncbi:MULTISPECIES: DUF305 domain-containing protein [unclassified Streptomyces]|uniref:DUF305 domain-containing protein n=1 Tax=unclassified Streptomyces TaxID=2593676 RepID=UPI000ADE1AA2|nr:MULTISPECIES: DUF305 domain-containing protein [unclassified Streptomyces]MDX6762858.1 DUF305 domain-containing protein [Streptomyces sp. F8]